MKKNYGYGKRRSMRVDSPSSETVQVFYSYAHEDERLLERFNTHLSSLKREKKIATWYDRDIHAGSDWASTINSHVNTADIILLLISPDFIASDYCYSNEAQRALERHRAGEARVIPIILKPVDWQHTPLSELQALPRDGKPITSYSDQDEACLEVAQRIRRVVKEMCERQTTQRSSQQAWTVPYNRNPFFTGRDAVLQEIHENFSTRMIQILSGLGGVGKTQTALEYTYRFRDDYRAILWARADSRELFISDLATFASPLELIKQRTQDQAYAFDTVIQWLKQSANWLLIVDNIEDLKLLRDLLPAGIQGHILCTTQVQATGIYHRINLDPMQPDEGALLLLRRSKHEPIDASEQVPESDRSTARILSELMGGLPLALDQAGAYVELVGCSLDDYTQTYEEQRTELLNERVEDSTGHPQPVTTTLFLALEEIKRLNEAAAELLTFYAFLAPDDIPEEILTKGAGLVGTVLETLVNNPLSRHRALGILRQYSLIGDNPISKTFIVHRLVQTIIKDNMSKEAQRFWAERTVRVINEAFAKVEFSVWGQCQRYISHAQLCANYIKQWNFVFPEAAHLLNEAGFYLYEMAQYMMAEPLLQEARRIRERTLEAYHPDIAMTFNHLGELYRMQGKYQEAEPLYQRALAIREQHLGAEHPDTASSLNNLAALYQDQGKYIQAKRLYQRALTIQEKRLGSKHPEVATSLNNLGAFYNLQRNFAQAEPLIKRALKICEQTLGETHPSTIETLENYATLLKNAKRNKRAAEIQVQIETIRAKLRNKNNTI
jgi:tetratricopeptide (TPR) repeat protein